MRCKGMNKTASRQILRRFFSPAPVPTFSMGHGSARKPALRGVLQCFSAVCGMAVPRRGTTCTKAWYYLYQGVVFPVPRRGTARHLRMVPSADGRAKDGLCKKKRAGLLQTRTLLFPVFQATPLTRACLWLPPSCPAACPPRVFLSLCSTPGQGAWTRVPRLRAPAR